MDTNTKQDVAANAMAEATAWLDQNGIGFRFIPPYQIKIDQINFWPGRGTITIDGDDQKRPEKGLDGLELLLNSEEMYGYIRHRQPLDKASQANPFRKIALAGAAKNTRPPR